MKEKRKLWDLLPRFFSLLFLLVAGVLAIRDGLQIDWWSLKDIVLICGCVSFFVTLSYYKKILTVTGIGLGTVIEVCLFITKWEQIRVEIMNCYNHVIPFINSYYHTSFVAKSTYNADSSRPFLWILIIFMGLWIGKGVACGKKRILTMFPLIPAFASGFLLGFAAELGAVVCLLVGMVLQLLIYREGKNAADRKPELLGVVCICLSVGIVSLWYQPVAEKLLVHHEEWREYQLAQEDKLKDFLKGNSYISNLIWSLSGGENTARLSNEAPNLSKDEIFTITLEYEPTANIYVKDFVGIYYEDGVWYPADEKEFQAFAQQQGYDAGELGAGILTRFYDSVNSYYESLNTKRKGPGQTVTIKTKKRTGNLGLLPYYADLPEQVTAVSDSGMRMQKKDYQFQMCRSRVMDWAERSSEYDSIWDEYETYIKEHYTQVPEELKEKLQNNLEETAIAFGTCTYSFDLEPVPEGKDIVEYFLFEQKKGYCMHFASAYTLWYRSMEIPARYVSGYIVLPEDFKENEDGTYTAVVTGQRAHAWMEIYNKMTGWTPEEATPYEYIYGLINAQGEETVEHIVANLGYENPEEPEVPTEPNEVPEEPKVPDKTPVKEPTKVDEKEPADDGTGGGNSDITNSVIYQIVLKMTKVFAVIFLITAILLAICLRRKIIWQRRNRSFRDEDTRKAAMAIIKEMFRLLRIFCILLKEQEDEIVFARVVEEKLPCFETGEFIAFIEIARAVRYGNGEITAEQVQYLYRMYVKVMVYEGSQMKWYQEVWYRYGVVCFSKKIILDFSTKT